MEGLTLRIYITIDIGFSLHIPASKDVTCIYMPIKEMVYTKRLGV